MNSENRPLSNSVALRTLFKLHRYCGILKIHIIRKINTGIRYEPVYRPALPRTVCFDTQDVTLKQRQLNRMYTVHYSSCFHVIMN